MRRSELLRLLPLLVAAGCFGTVDATDNVGPLLQITKPAATTVAAVVDFAASAFDESGIEIVEFFVDDVRIASDNTQPYETTWDTATSGDGPVILKVTARDLAGNPAVVSKTVTVRNMPDPG